jgi:hypothetical protein
MPTTPLALTKRSDVGSALTQVQFDNNYAAIQTAVNALITQVALALKDNGDLKDGTVKAIAQISDGLITAAKLAALADPNKGAFLRADKTTGVMGPAKLVCDKQTDSAAISSTGVATALLISTFTFTGLPAGDVMVWLDLSAIRNAGANGGTLSLKNGTTVLAQKPTHVVDIGSDTQWVPISMFGRLADFAGGDLVITLEFETSETTSDITFGVGGEGRFGRDAMVLAGL